MNGALRLWSVTTLLKKGLQTGEPLVYWNCEMTARAAIEKRSIVDAMLRDDGEDETVKWLVGQRYKIMERHQIRGTLVHKYAEAVALGNEPPTLDEQYEPYADQFVKWWRKWQPTFIQAEAPVYNLERAYAGTLDGIATFPAFPGRYLIDYKTTPKGPDAKSRPPYSEVALQLCAYAHAERVGLLADRRYTDRWERYYVYDPADRTEPMPKVDGALCVVISPFDCYAVPISIGETVWRTFQHVQALAEWHENGWKPAISEQRYDNSAVIAPTPAAQSRARRAAPFGPDTVDTDAGALPRPEDAPPTRREVA